MLNFIAKGGPLMYPLLICSFISLTVIIERTIFWIKVSRRRNQRLVDKVLDLAEKGDYDGATREGRGSRDYIARTLLSGIAHMQFSLSSALEMASAEEIKKMKRFLNVLDTMVTMTPLLGILGTVTGIIRSFDIMGTVGPQNPIAVTSGIAEALITTATGLSIALPALVFYNYFQSRVEDAAHDIEQYGTSLEIVFEKNKPQASLGRHNNAD